MRTQPAVLLLLLFGLDASFAPAATAQDRPAREPTHVTLTGRVLDAATGAPIHGAGIDITGARSAMSDAQGRFSVRLTPGTHVFSINQLGYDLLQETVVLEAGAVTHEFALTPRPVVLESIRVVEDRFRRRRHAVATSVRVLDRGALLMAGHGTATDVVRSRAGLTFVPCPSQMMSMAPCVLVRGRVQQVSVAIDDRPSIAGLDELATYQPHELYMIEIYGNGRHVRAYTTWYMEHAVRQRLQPVPLF